MTKMKSVLLSGVAVASLVVGCAEEESGALTFDDFFTQLPDAVCDHYEQCGEIAPGERAQCPQDLYDDLERDFACNGARGLFPQLETGLRDCVNGARKPCAATDDLDLFCPTLSLLEDECASSDP